MTGGGSVGGGAVVVGGGSVGGRATGVGGEGAGVVLFFFAVVAVSVLLDSVDGTLNSAYWPCVNGFHTGSSRGSAQSSAGATPSARSMKSFQIVAGNVPPATEMPWTFSIGIWPCG